MAWWAWKKTPKFLCTLWMQQQQKSFRNSVFKRTLWVRSEKWWGAWCQSRTYRPCDVREHQTKVHLMSCTWVCKVVDALSLWHYGFWDEWITLAMWKGIVSLWIRPPRESWLSFLSQWRLHLLLSCGIMLGLSHTPEDSMQNKKNTLKSDGHLIVAKGSNMNLRNTKMVVHSLLLHTETERVACMVMHAPLIPREVLPAATAFKAYSICTSLPDGENVVSEKL